MIENKVENIVKEKEKQAKEIQPSHIVLIVVF